MSKKEQKTQESEQRKLDKDRLRKQRLETQEREKDLKRSENEILRNSKPGEVHKFITVIMDSRLPLIEDLAGFFLLAEINYETTNSILQNSFKFKRECVYQAMGDDLKLHKLSKWEEEDQVFLLLEPEDIVPKVYSHIHDGEYNSNVLNNEIDIITFVKSSQEARPGKYFTLIIYGIDKYFKKMKKTTQQEFRDRVLNGEQQEKVRRRKQQLPFVSTVEFQSTMVELQLKTHITYRLVNTVEQLGRLFKHYIKSIAEAPFKRQRTEQGLDWFATADTAGSVKVEKDGKGLSNLWAEQLRLFGSVGIDTVQAIMRVYPSPKALIEKYNACASMEDGLDLLRDIMVRKGVGPLAKDRKLGPDLSRKIYRFFTSTNADRCLGSSQNL